MITLSTPNELKSRLASVEGFLLDMDGTFYLGDKLLPGALEFLEACARTGRPALFVTNNSSRDAAHYSQKLKRLGADVGPERVLTSGAATADYVLRNHPGAQAWVLGNPVLKAELAAFGINVINADNEHYPKNAAQPIVVAGYDTTLTFEKLCVVCDLVREGVPYIATHPDFNCPIENGYMPDLGAFIALIEASAGRKPDVIVGKPNRGLADAAAHACGVPVERLAMVGDRLYTDIPFGVRSGMTSILVLSGEATLEKAQACDEPPHLIAHGLGDLAAYL